MIPHDEPGPILNGLPTNLPDTDPEETGEWLDSLDAVIDNGGRNRARYVMLKLLERSRQRQIGVPSLTGTDYVNTIPASTEPEFPGDEELERGIRRLLRWNAAIMVHRAPFKMFVTKSFLTASASHLVVAIHTPMRINSRQINRRMVIMTLKGTRGPVFNERPFIQLFVSSHINLLTCIQ